MSLTLNVRMVCHPDRNVRLAVSPVPRERYQRVCPDCGMDWTITRRLVNADERLRMDALDWQSTDYIYSGKGE